MIQVSIDIEIEKLTLKLRFEHFLRTRHSFYSQRTTLLNALILIFDQSNFD